MPHSEASARAPRAGTTSARAEWPRDDLQARLLHPAPAHQQQPAAPAASAVSLTAVCYPSLALSSISQVQDAHQTVPSVFRGRARVLQAFPDDQRMWTVAESADCHEYRMVLQLSDEDRSVRLGAILQGSEAIRFFVGLPPTDLCVSNASLACLRARVEALCAAGSAEFCLKSCRPDPADTSETGVAYHIFGTTCSNQ